MVEINLKFWEDEHERLSSSRGRMRRTVSDPPILHSSMEMGQQRSGIFSGGNSININVIDENVTTLVTGPNSNNNSNNKHDENHGSSSKDESHIINRNGGQNDIRSLTESVGIPRKAPTYSNQTHLSNDVSSKRGDFHHSPSVSINSKHSNNSTNGDQNGRGSNRNLVQHRKVSFNLSLNDSNHKTPITIDPSRTASTPDRSPRTTPNGSLEHEAEILLNDQGSMYSVGTSDMNLGILVDDDSSNHVLLSNSTQKTTILHNHHDYQECYFILQIHNHLCIVYKVPKQHQILMVVILNVVIIQLMLYLIQNILYHVQILIMIMEHH